MEHVSGGTTRLAAVLTACLALLSCSWCTSAKADVQFRACEQKSGSSTALALFLGTPFTMPTPAGSQPGDVLMLTLRQSQPWGVLLNAFDDPSRQVRAWTPLMTAGELRTYYRVRQAGDPATYTLFSPLVGLLATTNISATLSAFSGADPAAPFASGSSQVTATGAGSHSLPNAAIARQGSLRYSASGTEVDSTFSYPGPMTATCTNRTGARSVSGASEDALSPGTTALRSVTLGNVAPADVAFQTYVLQPPMDACSPGSLGMSTPGSVSFAPTVLDGSDQTAPGLTTMRVDDRTEGKVGWRVSATSTRFTNGGGHALADDAVLVTGAGPQPAPGNCSMPINAVGYPLTLPSGATAPPAVPVVSASNGTGSGPVDVDLALSIAIPATTPTGTYTSNWTFTLSSGP